MSSDFLLSAEFKMHPNLMGSSILKIAEEHEMLLKEEEALKSSIEAEASNECIEFVRSLEDPKILKEEIGEVKGDMDSLVRTSMEIGKSIEENFDCIDLLVAEEREIKKIDTEEHLLKEILNIPKLLETLINTKHFREAVELIVFSEELAVSDCLIVEKILEHIEELKKRLFSEVIEEIEQCENTKKLKELLDIVQKINKTEERELASLYLEAKNEYLRRGLGKQSSPLKILTSYIEKLQKSLKSICLEFSEIFFEIDLIKPFLFKLIEELIDLYELHLPLISSFQELRNITEDLLKLDTEILTEIGGSIFEHFYQKLIHVTESKLSELAKTSFSHYENMIKLYEWESSKQFEDSLLEFGSLAVLHTNLVGIINQMRFLAIPELKEPFYEIILELLAKSSESAFNKGGYLLELQQLTRQESIYKNLFIKYIEVIFIELFVKSLLPSIKEESLATFEDSEEYSILFEALAETMQKRLLINEFYQG